MLQTDCRLPCGAAEPLTRIDYRVTGQSLQITPAALAVPKNIAGLVATMFVNLQAGYLQAAHPGGRCDSEQFSKLLHGGLSGTNQRPGLIADVRNSVEFHVLVNRLTNVGEGFLLGGSLGMAAGKLRTTHGYAVRVLEQGDVPNKVSLHGNQSAPALVQAQAVRVITQQRLSRDHASLPRLNRLCYTASSRSRLPNPIELLS